MYPAFSQCTEKCMNLHFVSSTEPLSVYNSTFNRLISFELEALHGGMVGGLGRVEVFLPLSCGSFIIASQFVEMKVRVVFPLLPLLPTM